jgi:RNA polymerase-binding transcription factor DksA
MAKKRAEFFPAKFLQQVWKVLSLEERRLAKEKERLAKEDPALRPEMTATKPAEFIDAATEGISQENIEMEKGILNKLLMETRLALSKMKIGRYGVCDNCGKRIDRARLEAYPQARYCLDCEKKLSLKKGA